MSDGGVYMDDTEEPRNIGEIDDMISQRRPSLSPTTFPEADFRAFKAANRGCLNEPMVMRDSFSIVRGETQIFSADKVTFDNLEPLIDDSMSDAQPDSYDGISPRLIPLHIRQELHEYIVPSKHEHGPALPNFLAEVKGPSGSEQVVQRQACYVAALGARGMHKLQEYVARSVRQFDRNAYTISTTYSWGSLKCYTTHLSPSSRRDGSIDYHMYQVGGWDLTGSAQQCREGMSAFRNCREWAQEQRDKWVALAVCRDSPSGTSIDGSASPGPEDSECSPDELGNEYGSKGSTHGARHLNKRLRVR